MQSVDSREKSTALILLAASTIFGVLASDFVSVTDGAERGGASTRLLLAAAVAGSLIAVLMLLSPGKAHRSLRTTLREVWPKLAGLAVLVIGYALALETLGFFVATSIFLAAGSVLLGERRWGLLLTMSILGSVALELILLGVFGLALNEPLMHVLGSMA